MNVSITRLKYCVADYPDFPEATIRLERQLQIGTGFHGKWYRSQRDHWLGWLVVQECTARKAGLDPASRSARIVWQRLNCSPMMFWLAETAGVNPDSLYRASQAAVAAAHINPKDGAPHGKMMREHLPWDVVDSAVHAFDIYENASADEVARDAFFRLLERNASYRSLARWL